MIKNIILLVCLIIISKSDKNNYLPMEKASKYGDDVCRYYDDGHFYVKQCEKGKYCVDPISDSESYLEICHDLPNQSQLSNLNEGKCKTTFECDGNLLCDGNTCTKCRNSNQFAYGEYPFTCVGDTLKGSGYCESVSLNAFNIPESKYSSPENYKKCGKYTIKEYPNIATDTFNGIYYIALDEYTYIGTVKDGEYVGDMELCESGFALPFYYGGYFDDPRANSATADPTNPYFQNSRYLRCVTPLSVNFGNNPNDINNPNTQNNDCSITYKINEEESLNYNVKYLPSSNAYDEIRNFCNEKEDFIKIKYDNFREYSKSITEDERKTCGDLENINKYTCENNGLIKSWYFYKNPKKYILYHNREKLEKVLNYFIQKDYPSYSYSKFLNYKIIFLLILFLL